MLPGYRPRRPQPCLDLDAGKGMTVSVGGFATDPVYDACFTVLVHNLVRGAAGACVLNAELAITRDRGGAMLANMRPQYSTSESPTSMY